MLPPLSRGLRLALIAGLAMTYVAAHGHSAFAKKHGDDDSSDSDDSDDSDSGSDKDSDDTDNSDENGNPDKDQPPVTAGGLFTMKTYPTSEIGRPMTLTQGILQMGLGVGTDLSAIGAFNTGGFNLDVAYGLRDNFMLIGGFDNAYNMKQYSIYAGFEGALVYDLLDIRVAADLHRFAYPLFCQAPGASMGPQPTTCDSSALGLPDGNYFEGGTQFSIDLGFPFRYPFTPGIAVVALQTLISIDFNGTQRGTNAQINNATAAGFPAYCSGESTDANGNPITGNPDACYENLAKPDLNPSLGFAFNPIPQLSIVVYGQLRIPDFDTAAGNFRIPVTLQVEASPNPHFDFGLAFTLLNVDPPDPQGPLDNRFLSAYFRYRYGH
jgi:hypothetical protein